MPKVLAVMFGDSHLQESAWASSKIQGDSMYSLEQIFSYAIRNKAKAVVGAGDLIDKQRNRAGPINYFHTQIDRLEEAKKAREADDKALEKYIDDFNERVKKVQQDIQTPWDKFAAQVENLNELLDQGGITQEEYGLAIEKAEEDMAKAEQTTKNTAQSLRDLDAVIFGSSDSFKRLAAYEESLNSLVAPDKGRARVGSTQGEDTGRVLAQIEKNTAKSADKEPVEFEEVGVD